MLFHESGDASNPTIVLLPDACCHWKRSFGRVVDLLEPDFHVVCASYDGFDEESPDSTFPDIDGEAACVEAYIRAQPGGSVHAVYGCGLGGLVASVVLQNALVKAAHVIIDGCEFERQIGMTAYTRARHAAKDFERILHSSELPKHMREVLERSKGPGHAYYEKLLEVYAFGTADMAFVSKQSILNQTHSALCTPIDEHIAAPGTRVHIFYPIGMGPEYLERYERHFEGPEIRRYDALKMQLLLCFPEVWASEVRDCCK